MVDVVDVVMQNPQNGAVIYASEATQARLGWITTHMSEIAPIDMAILSRQDIHRLPDFSNPDSFNVTAEDRVRAVLSEAIAGADIDPTLKQQYLDAIDPNVMGPVALEQHMNGLTLALMDNTMNNRPAANSIDLDHDGQRDISFITTPNIYCSAEEIVGTLSHVHSTFLQNIPGDGQDYVAAIMFHEAGHAAQNDMMHDHGTGQFYTTNPAVFEGDADARMVRAFNDAVAAGYDLDPAALDTLEAARFAGGLANVGLLAGSQMAAALRAEGQFTTPTSHNTGHLVDWDNGLPILPSESPLAELESAATFQVNYMLGLYDVVEQYEQTFGTDFESFTVEQQTAVEEHIGNISNNAGQVARNGAFYASVHPGASLAALETLHEKGYLGTEADGYVDQVRGFFENHATDILQGEGYQDTLEGFGEFLPPIDEIPMAEAPEPAEPRYERPDPKPSDLISP